MAKTAIEVAALLHDFELKIDHIFVAVSLPFEALDSALESVIWAVNSLQESQRELAATALEKAATTKLIKNVIEALGFRLRWKHVESREMQAKILDLITEAMVDAGRDVCLETLDLSLSRFKRWKRERKGCGLPQTKRCPRGALARVAGA